MADKTGLRFTAKTGALPEECFAVADFTLEQVLNRPFSLLLDLACARTDTDFATVLDQPCHLKICYNGELQHPLAARKIKQAFIEVRDEWVTGAISWSWSPGVAKYDFARKGD